MLSLFHSSLGLQAPLARPTGSSAVNMGVIQVGDVGTTRPLGVWDPLNLIGDDAVKYRRWQEMEIKHGRVAILDNSLFAQDPALPPGDVVGDKIPWVRYSD